MKNRSFVKREKMRNCFFFTLVLGFVPLFLFSCQSSEVNKWTLPKFVKEWEIKEIEPGLRHEIISVTANKNGVFVLVKAKDIVYPTARNTPNGRKGKANIYRTGYSRESFSLF